jgi:hypothetical protein
MHKYLNKTTKHPGIFSIAGATLFIGLGGFLSEGIAATAILNTSTFADETLRSATSTLTTDPGGDGDGSISSSTYIGVSPNNSLAFSRGSAYAGSGFELGAASYGEANSYSHFSFNQTITNATTTAQQYTLSGFISSGFAEFVNRSYDNSGVGGIDFSLYWYFNGAKSPIVTGSFSIDNGTSRQLFGGQSLTNLTSDLSSIRWDETAYVNSLGILDAGASTDLVVSANLSTYSSFRPTEFYDYANYASGFRASFGDPNTTQFTLSATPVIAAVPEPGEWIMMMCGLAVVVGISHRKNRKRNTAYDALRPESDRNSA